MDIVKNKYPNAPWMKIAEKYRGLRAVPGPKCDPIIGKWLQEVGQASDDQISWCAAAMNGVLKEAGYKGTGGPAARPFEKIGTRLKEFKPGCIVVLWRGSKDGWQGHVAFGEAYYPDQKKLKLFGGNQGGRFDSEFWSTKQLLAFIWPDKME